MNLATILDLQKRLDNSQKENRALADRVNFLQLRSKNLEAEKREIERAFKSKNDQFKDIDPVNSNSDLSTSGSKKHSGEVRSAF